jgi:hypothetical protein
MGLSVFNTLNYGLWKHVCQVSYLCWEIQGPIGLNILLSLESWCLTSFVRLCCMLFFFCHWGWQSVMSWQWKCFIKHSFLPNPELIKYKKGFWSPIWINIKGYIKCKIVWQLKFLKVTQCKKKQKQNNNRSKQCRTLTGCSVIRMENALMILHQSFLVIACPCIFKGCILFSFKRF